ncbi:MAG: hypothetical protein FWD26_07930 [Treponema sp.]|nr:hypothetical protein [Treponema sp.]
MTKKLILAIVILSLVFGTVFANEVTEPIGRHTITIDALQAMLSLAIWSIVDIYEEGGFILFTSLQYEFQIAERMSIAARFRYMQLYDILSLGGEAHFRFYPAGNVFFLDGMVGYSNLTMFNDTWNHYLTVGAKVGWRLHFGRGKGFILEPSIGYTAPFGLGNPQVEDFADGLFEWIARNYLVGGFNASICLGVRF